MNTVPGKVQGINRNNMYVKSSSSEVIAVLDNPSENQLFLHSYNSSFTASSIYQTDASAEFNFRIFKISNPMFYHKVCFITFKDFCL